jgi:hypothetical protein
LLELVILQKVVSFSTSLEISCCCSIIPGWTNAAAEIVRDKQDGIGI